MSWKNSLRLQGECGVIREPQRWPLLLGNDDAPVASIDWLDVVLPTYSQVLPSCVGHATANWIECMLRRQHGRGVFTKGEQIDGDAIYLRGREMFFAGKKGGGLGLPHGFHAAIDLGLLPPDTLVVPVSPTLRDLSQALTETPLIQGHVVAKDWQYASRDNGSLPGKTKANILEGAHATLLIGVWERDGKTMLPFQNSWGAAWGWNGIGQMTWAQWKDGARWIINSEDDIMRGDGPYTADLSPEWPKWTGWKEFVIQK